METVFERLTSFERYIKGPRYIFKYMGVDITIEPRKFSKYLQFAVVFNLIFITIHQMLYNFTTTDDNAMRSASISYSNYNVVGLGKILAIYFNRLTMAKSLQELKKIYPDKRTERKYSLEHYLTSYLRVEYLIWGFFRLILIFYLSTPLIQSFANLWNVGEYSYVLPIYVWSIVPMHESIAQYVFYYVLGSFSSASVGVAITGCDLCLFSSVSQLCAHFDLMSQQIMELQPQNEEQALEKLRHITRQHREVIKLANEVNNIFGPTIIFSLMSSSFILCFVAYQMLDDVSLIIIVKAFVLLMYESKQVIITCYFGNKLMECSSLINESLYMHNWVDGSVKYKRQILFMLMCTKQPFVLHVGGIANITLVTLKEVFSNAYQLFTVFKTT